MSKLLNTPFIIVSPLANESQSIRELVARTLPFLKEEDRVFFILDKKSTDDTFQILKDLAECEQRIVPVFYEGSKGMVDAYFHGYKLALDTGVDFIFEMDGGLSHEPEALPLFFDKIAQGYEYIGGSRFMKGGLHDGPLNRQIVSKVGTILSNAFLGTRMTDMTGGFECYSSKALKYVLKKGVMSRSYFFQTEIKYFMHAFNWVEVPIIYHNREAPTLPSSSITESLKLLWQVRKTYGKLKN